MERLQELRDALAGGRSQVEPLHGAEGFAHRYATEEDRATAQGSDRPVDARVLGVVLLDHVAAVPAKREPRSGRRHGVKQVEVGRGRLEYPRQAKLPFHQVGAIKEVGPQARPSRDGIEPRHGERGLEGIVKGDDAERGDLRHPRPKVEVEADQHDDAARSRQVPVPGIDDPNGSALDEGRVAHGRGP